MPTGNYESYIHFKNDVHSNKCIINMWGYPENVTVTKHSLPEASKRSNGDEKNKQKKKHKTNATYETTDA